MPWRKLRSEDQIPAFVDSAVELHAPLLDRLTPGERPFFFDHWLTRFNHSEAWLLPEDQGGPALVTMPRVEDQHEYRWQVRTLAVRADVADIELPDHVGIARSFLMPIADDVPSTRSPLAGRSAEPVQLGYVMSIEGVDAPLSVPWRFHETGRADVLAILDLLGRSYPWIGEAAERTPPAARPDLHRQREELRQFVEHGAGWCFHATIAGDPTPVAMASYLATSLPLLGVLAALVGDLAVDEAHRRQGLARALQRFACNRLHADGIRWLHGNIDPDNTASRLQAEAVGRSIWWQATRFRRRDDAPARHSASSEKREAIP